jgi:hypothetical protein
MRCLPAHRKSGSRSNPCRARSSLAVAGEPCRSTGGQIGDRGKVLRPAEPLRLEPAYLAGRRGKVGDRPVAHHPAHCRVAAQPLGVVHVLVAGQPPEHRLAQQARQPVATVLAGTCVRQPFGSRVGQAQRVIQLSVSQQPRIRGDRGTATAAGGGRNRASELHPSGPPSPPHSIPGKCLNSISELPQVRSK